MSDSICVLEPSPPFFVFLADAGTTGVNVISEIQWQVCFGCGTASGNGSIFVCARMVALRHNFTFDLPICWTGQALGSTTT